MSTSFRRQALIFLAMTLVVAVVYWPLAGAQFTNWDDNINVFANPHYLPVSARGLGFFWTHVYNFTYRPLVHTAWGAIAWLATRPEWVRIPGSQVHTFLNAPVFHAFNLLFHLLNLFLVWRLARLVTQREWAAAAGALAFALHPVQAESVGWVTGFNELLCATFSLGTIWCYCGPLLARANPPAEPPGDTAPLEPWRTLPTPGQRLAPLLFALAVLTKPAAVALPGILFLLETQIGGTPWRTSLRRLWPWAAAGVVWSVLTALLTRGHGDALAVAPPSVWLRPFVAGDAFTFYLSKLLWPIHLGIDYGRTPAAVLNTGAVWWEWLIPLVVLWGCWHMRRLSKWPFVAVASAAIWLLPVCGLVPFHFQLTYSTVADRYLYFALVVPALALSRGLTSRRCRPGLGGVALATLLWWGILCHSQAATWQNNLTLYRQAVRANPSSWMGHASLGLSYDNEGQRDLAAPEFRRALELNPRLWQMHVELARYAQVANRTGEARREWNAALAIKPDLKEVPDPAVREPALRQAR